MGAVGFLGLGSMGSAIAGRLLETGHDVLVWNRSPGPSQALASAGARVAESAAEALACETSFSMLANDEAAASVLTAETFGDHPHARVHICLASLSPAATDRLAAVAADAGVRYVAAPVLGRPPVAAAGELDVLAAGPPEALDRVAPLLASIGRRTWPMGPHPRTAALVKVAVNYNIIHALQAMAESIALVEAHGLDASEFTTLLSETLFDGVVYRGYGDLIARRAYRPAGFTVALGAKDLRLAEEAAEEAGLSLPTAPVLRAVFADAALRPGAELDDWSAIAEVVRGHVPR